MKSLLLLLVAACNFGGNSGNGGDDAPPIDAKPPGDGRPTGNGTVFDPAIMTVTIEIDYEAGQEPFTGNIIGFGDTFDITVANIDRLFAGKKQLAIPRTLAAMQSIGNVPDEQLTIADLIALANTHRNKRDTPTEKTYYVLFVSGHYTDANGVNTGVLGVSLGETGVIAMFKEVVRSAGIGNIQRYVEQSVLVHELGHAIGLVNNGVPLTSAHQDAPHGAHCTHNVLAERRRQRHDHVGHAVRARERLDPVSDRVPRRCRRADRRALVTLRRRH